MALALCRMGREAEAETHLDAVLAKEPTDETVLQPMAIAFKEMQQSKVT